MKALVGSKLNNNIMIGDKSQGKYLWAIEIMPGKLLRIKTRKGIKKKICKEGRNQMLSNVKL